MVAVSNETSTDPFSSESPGNGREVKFGAMLESLIERGGYSRNRKKILSRLGISAAALSQYIRGQTWPSFAKLLAIADFFDVSLDYLVYGQPASGAVADYGRSTGMSITPWPMCKPGAVVTPPWWHA